MTYPIATLVWGIPLSKEILDIVIPEEAIEFDATLASEVGNKVRDVDDLIEGIPSNDPPGLGFEKLYSASPDADDTAGYLGIALWDGAYWELKSEVFSAERTEELEAAKVKTNEIIQSLPEWFRTQLPEPGLQIVWSDS